MSDEVLENYISQLIESHHADKVAVAWQGGEPTLAGLDFFKRICELEQKHGKSGQVVGNGLQTNATLIDAEWAKFLAKFNWLVGVSLDGPREVDDLPEGIGLGHGDRDPFHGHAPRSERP